MEVAKTWLLLAAVIAVAVLGVKVPQQAQTIARLRAAAAPPPAGVAAEASPGVTAQPAVEAPAGAQPGAVGSAAELLAVIQERDRYKHGLERCVGELNQVTVAADRDKASAAVMARILGSPVQNPPAVPSEGRPDIVPLSSPPWVYPMGDFLLVEGKVFNRGSARGSATVAITVYRDGRSVSTERERVEVAAGESVKWSHQFRGGEGTWTASARVEDVGPSGRRDARIQRRRRL